MCLLFAVDFQKLLLWKQLLAVVEGDQLMNSRAEI